MNPVNPYEQTSAGLTAVRQEWYLEDDQLSRTTETVSLGQEGTSVHTVTLARTGKEGRQLTASAARCVTCKAPITNPQFCHRCGFVTCGRDTHHVTVDGEEWEVCSPCKRKLLITALFQLC
jgi:uncharacterized UBP type Zn finger protein